MKTAGRILLGGALVAALAAGTLGIVAAQAQEKPAAPAGPDHGALVKDLGSESFQTRTKAYEALESAGDAARKALEEGVRSGDAQVRWSAERLLRRLDGRGGEARGVLRFGTEAAPGGPFPGFEDLERRFEDMRRRMEDFRGGPRFEFGLAGPGSRVERHVVMDRDGERLEVREGSDGRITVRTTTRGADGKTTEETFEAKDMAALEKDHPEAARKAKGLFGEGAAPLLPLDRHGGGLFLPRAERPALGITVSPVPDVLRTQLSVKEGEGIVVEEVLPETPAARMGLRRHDVILSVNGIPVGDAAEVRSAVGAAGEGGALALRILRGGKPEEISGTR